VKLPFLTRVGPALIGRLRALRDLCWPLLILSALLAACAAEDADALSPPAAAPLAASAIWAAIPHHVLADAPGDYDPLLAAVGDARFVLLGESTHGTREFYLERARITERLVRERGVLAVAIEGDWPDADRLSRYVRGIGPDRTAAEALADFERFPHWMWRNAEFAGFVERLRAYNLTKPPARRVGVYGMDVQNLFEGQDAAVRWLARHDPPAAARARAQYRCFAPYRPDAARYGEATRRPARSCERQVAAVLAEFRGRAAPADPEAAEALFSARRSAATVVAAEAYYRASYAGAYSWNVRDRHMADAVAEIAQHAQALSGQPGRVVVWAHNTHVGDARSTEMSRRGELNIGQLLRDRHGREAFLVGLLTHSGTVMAAPDWDQPGRVHDLRPALPESFAGLLHGQGLQRALLLTREPAVAAALAGPRLERAIGVVYQPQTERTSHYFEASLARQFDAVVYIDRTRAVSPLP
jgi:erythromycin esterase-like protein